MSTRVLNPSFCALVASVFILSGCARVFTAGDAVIGTVHRDSGSNIILRTVLHRDTRSISFRSVASLATVPHDQKVTVTLHNTSPNVISLDNPGPFGDVAPGSGVLLYEGSLAGLLNRDAFYIEPLVGRTSCEFHIRFSTPLNLENPIQVSSWHASPPF